MFLFLTSIDIVTMYVSNKHNFHNLAINQRTSMIASCLSNVVIMVNYDSGYLSSEPL